MVDTISVQDQRAKDHKRLKRLALACLVMMAAIWVATYFVPAFPALGYIRAFAEAGLVGGFADWFAVTALFRHPLGIPIPHTAIIPRNKVRLGQTLGDFIRNSFLDPDLLRARLDTQNLAAKFGHWLERGGHLILERKMRAYAPYLASQMNSPPVRDAVGRLVQSGLAKWNAAPTLARILEAMIERGYHHGLVQKGIDLALENLASHQDHIKDRISEKSWKWMPKFVDQKIATKLIDGAQEYLNELSNPDHPFRQDIHGHLQNLINRLDNDPNLQASINAHKKGFLTDPALADGLMRSWDRLAMELERNPDYFARVLEDVTHYWLAGFSHRLRHDEMFQHRFNDNLIRLILAAITPWRDEVSKFVAGVVERWDSDTIVNKIEDGVGRDLQFIRLNGTLVGGLVGLILYTLVQVLA